MALSQSAVSELLEAFRAGDGADLIRESVRIVLQELIETEAAQVVGAERYERTPTRTTQRNGGRERVLSTQAGDVSLRIPKLRQGAFFPVILEPRRRIDQALHAVVMEAYVHGVSTRSVDDLVQALGIDTGISKSEVSRICAGLDEAVTAFRTRTLGHTGFPYVYLDATYLHVRDSPRAELPGQVVSKAVVIATGITAAGGREVLGLAVGDSEEETFWRAFLTDLKTRGLSGVRLVISDQHAGLIAALRRCFQGAAHQRCRVHFARNLLALIPKSHKDMVAAVLRTIFAQPDASAVSAVWDEVRDQLAASFPKVGPLMDDAKAEVLAFAAFPRAHWVKIWSNNPLERINKSAWNGRPRSARVVGHPRWRAEPLSEEAGRREQCEAFPRSYPSRLGCAQGLDLSQHSASGQRGRRGHTDQQRPGRGGPSPRAVPRSRTGAGLL